MTFLYTAWEPRNGRYVPVQIEGPIDPRSLSDFPTCIPETGGADDRPADLSRDEHFMRGI